MSTLEAPHIRGYVATEAPGTLENARATTHPPCLLKKLFVVVRQLVPAAALVSLWVGPAWNHPHRIGMLMTMPFTLRHVLIVTVLTLLWGRIFDSRNTEGRNTPRLRFLLSQMTGVFSGTAACAVVLWAGRVVLRQPGLRDLSLSGFVVRCGLGGAVCVLAAATVYSIAYRFATPRLYLILGSRKKAIAAYKKLCGQGDYPAQVLGFLDPDSSHAPYLPADYLGSIDRLEGILMRHSVDLVHLALPLNSHYQTVQEAIRICERMGVEYSFSPDVFETRLARTGLSPLSEIRGFVYHVAHEDYAILMKRALDLLVALVLLAVLAPVMVVIALAIKLTSRGPVLFTQQRYGHNRRLFRIYKFRSMVANAEELMKHIEILNEAQGPIFKIRHDPRITRVGRLLRRASLDELPQLFNVVRGEMSLVGPRPMSLRDVHQFSESSLMRRFSVKPGITGLWQVSGRSNTDFDTWCRLDMKYIDEWSLGLDLRILLQTVPAVLTGTGAV